MLNVAYCRVSTEEQAAEGFSIDGQAEKLRAYAQLHDHGPVTVIQDPDGLARTSSGPAFNSSSRWWKRDMYPTSSCGAWIGSPETWVT
jgi:hypothetical protein